MSRDKLFSIAQKTWAEIGSQVSFNDIEKELAFYKKMLSMFQIGQHYFFTFSPSSSKLEHVSDTIVDILGYSPKMFTVDTFFNAIHPDDVDRFVAFERLVVDFKLSLPPEKVMKYKSQYYYRIKKANGDYLTILQQSVTIQSNDFGNILRNFVIHTDISHLNPAPNKSTLSFIGLDGEPSFYHYNQNLIKENDTHSLTKREIEIIQLLSENKSTKVIAETLNLSPSTISTHRKNIHKKLQTHNSLELTLKAIENGWINV